MSCENEHRAGIRELFLKQRNGQTKKDKQRSTKHTHKSKDRVTRIPVKTGSEHRCSGRVSSSCSTIINRKVFTVFHLGGSLHVVFFVHMCVNVMKDRHKTPFLAADFTRWGDVQDVYWLLTELSSPDGGKINMLFSMYLQISWVSEWVGGCCLKPTQQYFSNSMAKTS
jgi:hypothetical protein